MVTRDVNTLSSVFVSFKTMSEASAEIIAKTQKSLGKYVKKPVLTEKLLKKPPFRFLHDVIKAVIKDTGFLNGLFSDDELNSENVKEKEAKVAFLTKLINAVSKYINIFVKLRLIVCSHYLSSWISFFPSPECTSA